MGIPTTSIGEVTYWLSGGTPKRSVTEYWNGEIPWISASTLKASEISESDQHVTPDAVARGSKMAPLNSTLLLVRGSALYNEIRAGLVVAPVCFNQDVKALVPRTGLVPKFLTYSLLGRARDLLALVSTAGNSAGVLDTKLVQALEIFFPPAPEQRAITDALSDLDRLLVALDGLIGKKRAIKQAIMQRLLVGRIRLPGFSGQWELRQLRQIVSTPITDGPHLTPTFVRDGIPFLSVNNLIGNKLDFGSLRFISRADHEEFSKKCHPRRGDILFGKAASVGEVALIDTDVELNIWSPLALIRVDPNASARFVLFALQTHAVRRQIEFLTNSSSQGNIGMGEIGRIAISLPSVPEQLAIATFIGDLDDEVTALEARREKTRAIKEGMMQQLLTGRVRLMRPATTELSA